MNSILSKLSCNLFIAFFCFSLHGQVILNEDFEGVLDPNTELPFSWTEEGLSTDGVFSVGTSTDANAGGYFPVPSHGKFAMSNDDVCNCNKSQDRLILPPLDFSVVSGGVRLNFSAVLDTSYNESAKVEISLDNGLTWNHLYEIPATDRSFAWQNFTLNLTHFVGQPNVLISFLYHDNYTWGSGFALDDVSVVAAPLTTDIAIVQLTRLSDYSMIPKHQGYTSQKIIALPIEMTVKNVGDLGIAYFNAKAKVYKDPDYINPIQEFHYADSIFAFGVSKKITFGELILADPGKYAVHYEVFTNGDNNTANDLNHQEFEMSDQKIARDIGNSNGGFVSAPVGTGGTFGVIFDVFQQAQLDTVLFVIAPQTAGGSVQVIVRGLSGGTNTLFNTTPDDNLPLGESIQLPIDQAMVDRVAIDGYAVVKLAIKDLNSNPLILPTNRYFIGIKQSADAGAYRLVCSDSIYTDYSVHYKFSGSSYSEFSFTYGDRMPIIRPILTEAIDNQTSDLFISEYAESGETNSYIELFNNTGSTIDLSQYSIETYLDGPSMPPAVLQLSGFLNHKQTYVIANPSATLNEIINAADVFDQSVTSYDQTDVIQLKKGSTVLDEIGSKTWGGDFSGWQINLFDDVVTTYNKVIIRKSGICNPQSEWKYSSGYFDWEKNEWDVYDYPYVADIGIHNMYCDPSDCPSAPYTDLASNTVIKCVDKTSTLEVSRQYNNSEIFWYKDVSSINPIAYGSKLTTNAKSDTSFFVVESIPNCGVTNRIQQFVQIFSDTIIDPVVTTPSTCNANNGAITFNGSGTFAFSHYYSSEFPWTLTIDTISLPYQLNSVSGSRYYKFNSLNGCYSDFFAFTIPNTSGAPQPTITASGPLTFCEGDSVVLTSSEINNDWSNGEYTQSITVKETGDYFIASYDGSCWLYSEPIHVEVKKLSEFYVKQTSSNSQWETHYPFNNITDTNLIDVCKGESLTFLGFDAISFSWDHGVINGFPFTPDETDTLHVSATFPNGCVYTLPFIVKVNEIPLLDAGPDIEVCLGQSVTLNGTSSESNASWSNSLISNGVPFVPSSDVIYTYSAWNASGCYASDYVSINVNPLPVVNAGLNKVVCSGNPVTLTGSGASIYNWDQGVLDGISFVPTASGNYTLTGIDANGCQNTDVVSVIVNQPPTVNAGADQTVCEGTSVTLNGTTTATSGSWIGGTVSNGVAFAPSNTATYVYSSTSANGCTGTDSMLLTLLPNPIVDAGSDLVICQGESISLSGSGAASYQWDQGVIDQVPFTPLSSGTYTLIGTDANACQGSDQINVTVNSSPVITAIANNTTACGANDGSISVSGAGNGMLYLSGTQTSAVSVSLPFTLSNLAPGSYQLHFESALSCSSDTLSLSISEPGAPAKPTISASSSLTFCDGQNITLSASTANGIMWSSGETSQSIVVSTTGNYFVTVSQNGCSNSSDITSINVMPTPVISVTSTTNPSSCTTADGSIDLSISGGSGTLSWTGTSSGTLSLSSSAVNISGLDNGAYTFVMDDGCQSLPISLSLNDPGAPAPPSITVNGSTAICTGQTRTLTSSATSGNVWSNGATSQSITVSTAGNYFIELTDVNGCTSTSAATTIIENSLPLVQAGSDQTICIGESITLNGSGALNYIWSPTASNGIPFTPTLSAIYQVTGTDVNGCSNTDQMLLVVNALPLVNAGSDLSVCEGESVSLSASGAQTYVWDQGVLDGVAFTPTVNGTYIVSGTDANGCSNTDQLDIIVNPLPNVSAGNDFSICQGENVILVGSGASSYVWDQGVIDGAIFTPPSSGIYTVTGTDGNGCSNTDQIIININPLPIVDAGSDLTVCLPGQITVTASGAVSYVWTNGIVNDQAFDPIAQGLIMGTNTLTVIGTDANGCSASDELIMTVDSCVGIGELNQSWIKLYPNPGDGLVTISIHEDMRYDFIKVTDQLGRVVAHIDAMTELIDLRHLASGKYLLIIQSTDNRYFNPIEFIKL